MIEALELLTSAACNLRCKYCYIPKSPLMNKLHNEILSSIRDGLSFNDNNIKYIGFWGAEPIFSIDSLINSIGVIKSSFPNIREISFSTNGTDILKIKKLLSSIKDIKFKIQFSIDGPEYINGMNRAPGILDIVLNNMKELLQWTKEKSIENLESIETKSTITIANMCYMLENNLIKDFIDFWRNMHKELSNINENIRIFSSESFTLEVPGRYSKEDGKIFCNFLKEYHKYGDSSYTFRLQRVLDFQNVIWTKHKMFTCSGGDSNIGLDHKSNIHICHRTFLLNNKEYVDSIIDMPEYKNWDVSLLDKGMIENINKNYIVDNSGLHRFLYVMRGYHDFPSFKINSTRALIYELARAGQINDIYINNNELTLLFSLFLNTGMSCPSENVLNTGSLHVTPVSLIRLWGNGAFEELVRRVSERE